MEKLESQLKKSLILDGKVRIAMKSILAKAGYKVYAQDRSLTEEFFFLCKSRMRML